MALAWAAPTQAAEICQPYQPRPVVVLAEAPYRLPDGRVRVVGYNDMAEMLGALGTAFTARQPEIRFVFTLEGTRTAPPALIDGTSAFAPMGAEFTHEDLTRYRARWGAEPVPLRIAHDSVDPRARSSPIGIFVNSANPLARITLSQVRGVLSGRITRWNQLGLAKPPGSIHPTGLAADRALGLYMRNRLLGGGNFAPGYAGFNQSRAAIAAIASDPQALGFADLSHASKGVRALALAERHDGPWHSGSAADVAGGTYPLDRHLLIYAPHNALATAATISRAFLDFALSCEGQAIVAQGTLGYAPLDPESLAGERSKLGKP